MKTTISVDTGGTFTDVIVTNADGVMTVGKALTTPDRIFLGVREAIKAAADNLATELDVLMQSADMLIYGTTRATNAVVTKNVAKTAFVTTEGFGDILVLKEGGKFNPHDFSQDYPKPFVARSATFEIEERMNSEGSVSLAMNELKARAVAQQIREEGYEAVAVCFLWSIANPDHELQFAQILGEEAPDVAYSLSHQLNPVVREYRRASATAIDASLKPLMQEHLIQLKEDLGKAGFFGELLVSTTAGGCNVLDALVAKPIYTIGSGPAMAPIASLNFSVIEELGDNVIVCDTGGTTFDVGLVRDGQLTYTRDTWLGPRFTGDLMGISAVDMRSIGAGGGSIAWVDEGGLMRVGPQSAGADPGPACYGRGGELPTVSDAAVVLGYFDPEFFLGGKIQLDVQAAHKAIQGIATEVGISVEQAAYQILSLASDFMMRAIEDITVNEGVNPRESTIVAGGGAAGLNILLIAKELGCRQVLLPKVASALSASGMQFANIVGEEASSFVTLSNQFDLEGVNETLRSLVRRLEDFRSGLGAYGDDYTIEYFAEARYLSQVWELDTPLEKSQFKSQADVDELVEAFHTVHERVFAVRDEQSPVEIVNWKARLTAKIDAPSQITFDLQSPTDVKPSATRSCYFGGQGFVETSIFKSEDVPPGSRVLGPAIIEEPTTTVVVYPGMSAEVTASGNYLLNLQ